MRKLCRIFEKISICQFYRKYGFFILNTTFYRAEYGLLSSKTWQHWFRIDIFHFFFSFSISVRRNAISDSFPPAQFFMSFCNEQFLFTLSTPISFIPILEDRHNFIFAYLSIAIVFLFVWGFHFMDLMNKTCDKIQHSSIKSNDYKCKHSLLKPYF